MHLSAKSKVFAHLDVLFVDLCDRSLAKSASLTCEVQAAICEKISLFQ
jgi:hypothetical protein